MTQTARSFRYDVALLLNASALIRPRLPTIEAELAGRRLLAATLNHRFFTIDDKNHIKANIEAHSLDHLMFSMRPSSHYLLNYSDRFDVDRFIPMSELIYLLQVMARYDIPEGILSDLPFSDPSASVLHVAQVEPEITRFLNDLESTLGQDRNIRKQFPWIFSIQDQLDKIWERRITPITSIAAAPSQPPTSYNEEQIGHLEKDIFWIGFDPSYSDVPRHVPYPETNWTSLAARSMQGKGLFANRIRYCARCCLPETMEGITFDEFGVCVPCRSSEEKMHINWEERTRHLHGLIDTYRSQSYYDCMLPMSGGKDSAYQAHILCRGLDITPLAVTHGQNWSSRAGRYNLENCLQKFDLDHITFNMGRRIINHVARKSLEAIGDACWHCHIGAGAFPVQTAVAWDIDLMCYGESTAEADGRGSYNKPQERSLTYNLDISAKVKAEDMADAVVNTDQLSPWNYPTAAQIGARRIMYIHLGDYFFWDEERQVEFLKRNYEWMESYVENAYKGYKSVECVMAGVHDYANFIKRGIGRATIQASTDVRRGLLTREEGFELAKKFDTQRPHALDFYLELTGLDEGTFEDTLRDARDKSAYARKLGGA